jgi:hydroxypyruvate reductase/glycerate 2-kinase
MATRWNKILNRNQLLANGPAKLRVDAIDIIEHAIRAADPYSATKRLLHLEGNIFRVGKHEYSLDEWESIYIIGAGKASQPIVMALEETLGEHITDGLISIKQGEEASLNRVQTIESGHPVPDKNSHHAAQEIIKIAQRAGKNDIVFSAFTGGSSALVVSPLVGITLEEKQELNRLLLDSGAAIREINALRKHLSQIKGGRLALEIFPAELINLTVSDVIGDPLDYITGLTVPDTSTWEDALCTMDRYNLWDQVPSSIRQMVKSKAGGETPKQFNNNYTSHIVVHGDAACSGAIARCKELGYETELIAPNIEGESCSQAFKFISDAKRIIEKLPSKENIAIVASGETTVAIDRVSGEGGPNQEFALCAAMAIEDKPGTIVAAVGTDGTDGPGDASGGLVDSDTIQRALSMNLDPRHHQSIHASSNFLKATGDLIITGPTGTNVNDIVFMLIHK